MPRLQARTDQGRHGGQLHQGLGDPAAGVGQHPGPQGVELLGGRHRADHDALAAGAVHRLDHQLGQPVHHLLAGRVLLQPPGVDVADDRLLAQVVADQVRHVGVDQLVVGHAVADRVGQRHPAAADGVDQTGDAEHRVLPEVHRVDEVVVDPAVDDVDPPQPGGGAHEHPAAPALEVAALDQLDAHGAGQQGVLEVGRVVDTGGQHDHRRVVHPARGGLAQRGQQPLGVAVDRPDPLGAERLRHGGHHGAAVGHHVRDPAGHPDVVLQHPDVTLGRTDQVDATDVHPDAVRRLDAPDRAVVVAGGGDQLARDDPVGDHPAVGVDVGEERLQGADPLRDTGVDDVPVVGRDDPGHDVQRERSLDATDVEGDAGLRVVVRQ